jgi:short-subunit dehydrogenase
MKQCVITGAADGIGRALAYRFAQAGYAITGIDVDAQRAGLTCTELKDAGYQARFIVADLASSNDIAKVAANLITGPPVDVLIHNAGINAIGAFKDIAPDTQQRVIDVNLLAPMLLSPPLLASHHISDGGSLVFISSLSHFVSYPGAAVYAASKDGLASYARSLSVSLAAQKIDVLTVFPGPTRTAHARRYSPDNNRENRRMLPELLADKIFKAVSARKQILIPGIGLNVFAALGLLFPVITNFAMRKTLFDKLRPRP